MKLYERIKALRESFPIFPPLARVIGLDATVFISFLCWRQHNEEDWIEASRSEIEDGTTLGRSEQEAARRKLKRLGYLEEKEDRLAHKKYYRPNYSTIEADVENRLPEGRKSAVGTAENQPSTNDKDILKDKTRSSAAVAAAPSGEEGSHLEQARKAEHSAFMALWHEAFQVQFGRPYVFQGGMDGKALKTVLAASKMQAKDLMSIATKAWAKRGRDFFHCEAAVTIKYFCEHINQILSELEKRKPGDLPAPRIKAKSPPPGLLPVSDQPTPGYDKAGNEISMAEWDRLYPLWNYYEVDTLEPCAPPPLAS